MKPPKFLIKFSHNYLTKNSHNFNNSASRKTDAGFTILELLVIVILLGTLAAIAAPGWLGFITRQRVRTVNDRVFQSLRAAQSEAKRTKRDVTIEFLNTDPPTVNIDGKAQSLNAEGEIKAGQVTLTVTPNPNATTTNSLTFDYQGNLPPNTTPFVVTVAPTGGGGKQCAIVQTLIGGMRTGEGNDPANGGCP